MSPEPPGSPFPRPQPGRRADPGRRGGLPCPRRCSLSSLSLGASLSSPDLGKLVAWDDHDSHLQLRRLRPTAEQGFARVSGLDPTYRSPRTTPMCLAGPTSGHTHDRPRGRPVTSPTSQMRRLRAGEGGGAIRAPARKRARAEARTRFPAGRLCLGRWPPSCSRTHVHSAQRPGPPAWPSPPLTWIGKPGLSSSRRPEGPAPARVPRRRGAGGLGWGWGAQRARVKARARLGGGGGPGLGWGGRGPGLRPRIPHAPI